MCFPKAKYAERVPAEKRIDVNFASRIHIFARFQFPKTDNRGRKIGGWRRKRIFLHVSYSIRITRLISKCSMFPSRRACISRHQKCSCTQEDEHRHRTDPLPKAEVPKH
jgi:hypothetical protein